MSQRRDTSSRIWPGELCWVRFLVQGGLRTDQEGRNPDQREITVHARARCVRAWRLKRLLRRKGYTFEVVEVTGEDKSDTRPEGTNGIGAAPRVFIDGRLVGGLGELKMLERSGNLDRLLGGTL